MNAISTALAPRDPPVAQRAPDPSAIRSFFVETLEDFHRWSPGYNMHFGYWVPGANPFDREAMLERLSIEAIAKLNLAPAAPVKVIDLGCGAGATARTLARLFPRAEVTGVTIVHEQIELGVKLNRKAGLARRIGYVLSDFTDTWTGSASQDGAIAIESFCYAPGPDKAAAAREAARLLRPGARLVVVDGFLVGGEPRGLFGWIYRRWCDSWAIPELARLGDFTRALERAGFEDVEARDLFWHIAPSAAHIPGVALAHMVRELWTSRGRLTPWRWRHILASWLSIALGLAPWRFKYCLVNARKKS
jgi:cyclopropane fatty-acyl-phospholipid synthase-like methyltransferase